MTENTRCQNCYSTNPSCTLVVNGQPVPLCLACYDDSTVCEWCNTACYSYQNVVVQGQGLVALCDSCFNDAAYCEDCDIYYEYDHDCPYDPDYTEFDGSCVLRPAPYDYTPLPVFHDVPKVRAPWYMGVELEFNAENVSSTLSNYSWAYYKTDGSVHGIGLELVTMPFSLDWYEATGRREMVSLLEELKENDATTGSADNAGMHIHVSRTAFEDSKHLYRFMRMFYLNSISTLRLSRRTSVDSFLRWSSPKRHMVSVGKTVLGSPNHRAEKYQAVNLTHTKTVEVRIFTGTLNPIIFDSNVRVVAACVDFTRQLSNSSNATLHNLANWIQETKSPDWRYTANRIRRCALLPESKMGGKERLTAYIESWVD